MPSNPNIALSVKTPQFRSPLDTFARAQQIATNNMAMQKAQTEAAAANAMQTYLKGGGKLETAADIAAAAKAGVDPSVAQKIAQQNLDLNKFSADQKKTVTERLFNRLGAVARAGELGSSNEWVNWLNDYSKLGEEEFREAGEFLTMTKGRYDPSIVKSLMAGAEKYFEKTTPQAQVKEVIGDEGQIGIINMGGGVAPTITIPSDKPASGGVGGPMEPVPMGAAGNDMAGVASVLSNVANDAEYQTVLNAIDAQNPQMAASIRQAMPRFDPQRMAGIRSEAKRAFGGAPDQPGLVAGERGGVGGPDIPVPTSFRARVPSPPVGPQPRETADEVYQKEKARIEAQRDAPPPKPVPLTEAQRLQRRDALAGEFKKAQGLLDKTYGPAGIMDGVRAVRNLSRPQKEAITGYSAYAPSVFSSSKDADTAIENLKGTVTELGKEAAAATGAIGSMAVQEWTIVRNMIVNLDLEGMTPEALDRQLDIIEAKAKSAAQLTQRAFDAQYGNDIKTMPEFRLRTPAGAGGSASKRQFGSQYPVMTPEQVRKAPKGTKYYTTDGRFGVRP